MPVMASTSLVAASTGSDEEYAASGTALTTVLSLLMIPVYMLLHRAGAVKKRPRREKRGIYGWVRSRRAGHCS